MLRPLSDGGPGFVDAVAAGLGGERRSVRVSGPLRRRGRRGVPAHEVRPSTRTNLARRGSSPRQPPGCTWCLRTAGTPLGPPRSGSGSSSPMPWPRGPAGRAWASAAPARATAVRACSRASEPCVGSGELTAGRRGLTALADLDLTPVIAALAGVRLEVATDVDVPLLGPRGAARGFAAQKGATPEQVDQLEEGLRRWAHLLGRTEAGLSPAVALGAGAGGGLAAALIRVGAHPCPRHRHSAGGVRHLGPAGRRGGEGRPGRSRARAASTGSHCMARSSPASQRRRSPEPSRSSCSPGGWRSAGGSGSRPGCRQRSPPLPRRASRLRPGWRRPRSGPPGLGRARRDLGPAVRRWSRSRAGVAPAGARLPHARSSSGGVEARRTRVGLVDRAGWCHHGVRNVPASLGVPCNAPETRRHAP